MVQQCNVQTKSVHQACWFLSLKQPVKALQKRESTNPAFPCGQCFNNYCKLQFPYSKCPFLDFQTIARNCSFENIICLLHLSYLPFSMFCSYHLIFAIDRKTVSKHSSSVSKSLCSGISLARKISATKSFTFAPGENSLMLMV